MTLFIITFGERLPSISVRIIKASSLEAISNTQESVSSDMQTRRGWSKISAAPRFFNSLLSAGLNI